MSALTGPTTGPTAGPAHIEGGETRVSPNHTTNRLFEQDATHMMTTVQHALPAPATPSGPVSEAPLQPAVTIPKAPKKDPKEDPKDPEAKAPEAPEAKAKAKAKAPEDLDDLEAYTAAAKTAAGHEASLAHLVADHAALAARIKDARILVRASAKAEKKQHAALVRAQALAREALLARTLTSLKKDKSVKITKKAARSVTRKLIGRKRVRGTPDYSNETPVETAKRMARNKRQKEYRAKKKAGKDLEAKAKAKAVDEAVGEAPEEPKLKEPKPEEIKPEAPQHANGPVDADMQVERSLFGTKSAGSKVLDPMLDNIFGDAGLPTELLPTELPAGITV